MSKSYLAEINGRMRVVTKTGRTARGSSHSVTGGSEVLSTGGPEFYEVSEVKRVGRGEFRHWVRPTDLYEVTG